MLRSAVDLGRHGLRGIVAGLATMMPTAFTVCSSAILFEKLCLLVGLNVLWGLAGEDERSAAGSGSKPAIISAVVRGPPHFTTLLWRKPP